MIQLYFLGNPKTEECFGTKSLNINHSPQTKNPQISYTMALKYLQQRIL